MLAATSPPPPPPAQSLGVASISTPYDGRPRTTMSTAVPVSSLVNSIKQTRFQENDRLYYQRWNNIYPYPSDDYESERLDCLHHLIYEVGLAGALHVARVSRPSSGRLRILDIGCGTGIWASEMASLHPEADVFGFDIGDVNTGSRNGNLHLRSAIDFEVNDLENEFGREGFHFIHMAQLQGGVSDWPALLRKAHRMLKPGGHLEIVEIDWAPRCDKYPLPPTSPSRIWWEAMQYATDQIHKPLHMDADVFRRQLIGAGFAIMNYRSEHLELAENFTLHEDDQQRSLSRWTRFVEVSPELRHFESLSMALLSRLPCWNAQMVLDLCERIVIEVNRFDCPIHHVLHIWTVRKAGS